MKISQLVPITVLLVPNPALCFQSLAHLRTGGHVSSTRLESGGRDYGIGAWARSAESVAVPVSMIDTIRANLMSDEGRAALEKLPPAAPQGAATEPAVSTSGGGHDFSIGAWARSGNRPTTTAAPTKASLGSASAIAATTPQAVAMPPVQSVENAVGEQKKRSWTPWGQETVASFNAQVAAPAIETTISPTPSPARVVGSPSSPGSSTDYMNHLQGVDSWEKSAQGKGNQGKPLAKGANYGFGYEKPL